jgi:hypothetical protein
MSDTTPAAPTRSGEWSGRDSSSGVAWAFESPSQHWAAHDERQIAYWRSRPVEERLAQAAEYRLRRHGDIREPTVWSWRLLPNPYD